MMTEVAEAIAAVNQTGQVNMLDRLLVIDWCRDLGYREAAVWIAAHPREYARIVLTDEQSALSDITEAVNP